MKFFLFIFLFSLSFSTFSYVVVTDLDDTIKITNVHSASDAVYNGIFTKKAFYGMPNIIQAMGIYAEDIYILSASPSFIKSAIKGFLKKNKIPYTDLFTRGFSDLRDKKGYKKRMIYDVLKKTSEPLILIGDNQEIDEEIYLEIKKEYPNRILEIYIHNVSPKVISTEVTPFFTAFDIAFNEFENGRMDKLFADIIGGKLLSLESDKMKKLIPRFATCPTDYDQFSQSTTSEQIELKSKLDEKVINYCSARN